LGDLRTTTGQLSWQPVLAHVGTYSNIRPHVSDGRATAALPAVAIQVVQPSNGAATLTWTPPDGNTDGSALTNLAGYRSDYGTRCNALTNQVPIANPSVSTYVVHDLSPGTCYFGVSAYNSQGSESVPANLASKTIQCSG
jgi:hypothetical protein